jgi:hypothetical protein
MLSFSSSNRNSQSRLPTCPNNGVFHGQCEVRRPIPNGGLPHFNPNDCNQVGNCPIGPSIGSSDYLIR